VKLHLIGEIGVNARAPKERTPERDNLMDDSHAKSPVRAMRFA